MNKIIAVLCALIITTGCTYQKPLKKIQKEKTVTVGLVLRKQFSTDPTAPRIFRHVDTMLGSGELVGFFNSRKRAYPLQIATAGWQGHAGNHKWICENRKRYVDINAAKKYVRKGKKFPQVSVWVRWKVTPTQARDLQEAWNKLTINPPTFRLVGRNCASFSAHAMFKAKILRRAITGITGIDRPENLLNMIKKQYAGKITTETGYFGYVDGKPTVEKLVMRTK